MCIRDSYSLEKRLSTYMESLRRKKHYGSHGDSKKHKEHKLKKTHKHNKHRLYIIHSYYTHTYIIHVLLVSAYQTEKHSFSKYVINLQAYIQCPFSTYKTNTNKDRSI